MSTKDTYVTLASYDSVEAAEADWDESDAWIKDVYVADAALVTKDAEGNWDIVNRMKHHGWGKGLLAGAVIGILFPPSLLAAGAVGAFSGAAVARLNRSLDKDDVKDLAEQLDNSTTVIAFVTNKASVNPVRDHLGRAKGFASTQGAVDWDDEDLKNEFIGLED